MHVAVAACAMSELSARAFLFQELILILLFKTNNNNNNKNKRPTLCDIFIMIQKVKPTRNFVFIKI
jgi:hypothetical protein